MVSMRNRILMSVLGILIVAVSLAGLLGVVDSISKTGPAVTAASSLNVNLKGLNVPKMDISGLKGLAEILAKIDPVVLKNLTNLLGKVSSSVLKNLTNLLGKVDPSVLKNLAD